MRYTYARRSFQRLAAILVLLSCVSWQLLAKEALTQKQLITELDHHRGSSLVKGARLGLGIWDVESGKLIYSHQDSLLMAPASTQKLFTAVAAFEQLGPDFRWQTTIGYRGQIVEGTLKGDLIVIGSGDPTWHEDFWPEGGEQLLALWADSLKTRGISTIEGNLVANVSHFPTKAWNPAWDLSDKPYGYAPAVSSLSLNANRVTFNLKGGKTSGKKVAVSSTDSYNYITLSNALSTSKKSKAANTWAVPTKDAHKFIIKGSVPAGGKAQEKIGVREPEYYCMLALKYVMQKKGITLKGKILSDSKLPDPDSLQVLFNHLSPPLSQVCKVMLKTSSNFIAESLLHSLDRDYKLAIGKVLTALDSLHVSTRGMKIQDGNGLSRTALCSPLQMGTMLCEITHQDWFEHFFGSLSIAGIDGTLQKRFSKSPARGSVFAKTGSMSGISNLAGYLKTKDGRLLAFVAYGSKLKSVGNARKWQEALCDIVYRYIDTDQ